MPRVVPQSGMHACVDGCRCVYNHNRFVRVLLPYSNCPRRQDDDRRAPQRHRPRLFVQERAGIPPGAASARSNTRASYLRAFNSASTPSAPIGAVGTRAAGALPDRAGGVAGGATIGATVGPTVGGGSWNGVRAARMALPAAAAGPPTRDVLVSSCGAGPFDAASVHRNIVRCAACSRVEGDRRWRGGGRGFRRGGRAAAVGEGAEVDVAVEEGVDEAGGAPAWNRNPWDSIAHGIESRGFRFHLGSKHEGLDPPGDRAPRGLRSPRGSAHPE